MCSARPAAVPPPWDPARGCIEGIELLKLLSSRQYLRPGAAPPVSHTHAAGRRAVGAGSVTEMTQGYKY